MPASAMRRCSRRPSPSSAARSLAEIGFGRDVNDFTAIATRVAGLGKVDVIPTYTLEGQGLKITQALAQAGVIKGGGGNAIQLGTIWLPFGFEQKAGKAALGLYPHRAVRPDRPARRGEELRRPPSRPSTTPTRRTSTRTPTTRSC